MQHSQLTENILPQNHNCNLVQIPRFDIASALAIPFRDLANAKETQLHKASRNGDCEKIRGLLSGSFSCNQTCVQPTTKYSYATKYSLNERNHLGATPLWLAAVAGHKSAVKLLIENGADLEIEDIKGQTPLYAATKFNHIECVRILLEAGANPDGSSTNISTPIYITARDNYPRVMALLINHGADVNGRLAKATSKGVDYPGNLPAYMTLVYQHYECFQQLVKGGADLCLPPSLNGAGECTSLIHGALRYACDVRCTKLLALCGGIKDWDEIQELTNLYRGRPYGPAKNTKESIEFLEAWKGQPMSLTSLSRIAIRQRIGQKRLRFIKDLTFPKLLKDYLSMSLLEI